MVRIDKYYKHIVAEDLIVLHNYKNVFELPFFESATWSCTSKRFALDKRDLIYAFSAAFLSLQQKGVETRAHKAIAPFQLRKDVLLGSKATLRGRRLAVLLDKLLVFVLPLIKAKTEQSLQRINEQTCVTMITQAMQSNVTLSDKENRYDVLQDLEKNDRFNPGNIQEKPISRFKGQDHFFSLACVKTHIGRSEEVYTALRLGNKAKCSEAQAQNIDSFQKGIGAKQSALRLAPYINVLSSSRSLQVNQFTIGQNNLLVLPELQAFFPFFDTCGGFNLTVAFTVEKKRGTQLATQSKHISTLRKHKSFEAKQVGASRHKALRSACLCLLKNSARLNRAFMGSEALLTSKAQLHYRDSLSIGITETLPALSETKQNNIKQLLKTRYKVYRASLCTNLRPLRVAKQGAQGFVCKKKQASSLACDALQEKHALYRAKLCTETKPKAFYKMMYLSLHNFDSKSTHLLKQFIALHKRTMFFSAFQYPTFL